MRQCPTCRKSIACKIIDERDEDEQELKSLCMQLNTLVNSGKLEDVPGIRREIVELNASLNIEWASKFIRYIDSKLREARVHS